MNPPSLSPQFPRPAKSSLDHSTLDQAFAEYLAKYAVNDVSMETLGSAPHRALGPYEIRLVSISEPGINGSKDMIRCQTRIFHLHDRLKYTALSYAWGSPIADDGRYTIQLDDRVLLLPKNLWRFLNQTRKMGRSGWLWIDALSIDQDSPWERNCQVRMMSEIFYRAKQVVVWLGPAYEGSDKAMDSLTHVDVDAPVSQAPWERETSDAQEETYCLCQRAYWGRLWVFQELRCARQIVLMCGNRFLPWNRFHRATYYGSGSDILGDTLAAKMIRLFTASQHSMKPPLWYLMSTSRHLCCADPRDRAYALVSCARSGRSDVKADYTISTTTLVNVVLRNICMSKIFMPNLTNLFGRCKELIEMFDLEPDAFLGITEGVLKGFRFNIPNTVPDFYSTVGEAAFRTDYGGLHMFDTLESKIPFFHILSGWAQSDDPRIICKLLIEHMGLIWDLFWDMVLQGSDFDGKSSSRLQTTSPMQPDPWSRPVRRFGSMYRYVDGDGDCDGEIIRIPPLKFKPRPSFAW